MTELLTVLGRFHVLVLHLPIGILAIAFLAELQMWRKPALQWGEQVRFILKWGAFSGIAAAGLGWLLAFTSDYTGSLLSLHQWFGTATAALLILLWRLYPKLRRPLFVLTAVAMALTGHFGGSLTHGEDFLTPDWGAEQDKPSLETARIYDDLIAPILAKNCSACHKPGKKNGQLLLTTHQGILEGGESGPVVVTGDAAESMLIQLVASPVHEKRHMPPKGKPQLTSTEVRFLKWWIDQGAAAQGLVTDFPSDPDLKDLLEKHFAGPHPLAREGIAKASPADIQELESQGFRISLISPETPYLRLNLSDRQDLSPEVFAALAPIEEQVTFLDLGNSNLNDELTSEIAAFPHLQTLRLDQTEITDQGLQALADLDFLASLDLSRTTITEEALAILEKISSLKQVNLWGTDLKPEILAKATEAHPEWELEYGQSSLDFSDAFLLPPVIQPSINLFNRPFQLALESPDSTAEIRYTLDGNPPTENSPLYTDSLSISSTLDLQARCFKNDWEPSEYLSHSFFYLPHPAPKILKRSTPDERYPGPSPKALTDLKLGAKDFNGPEWTGYFGENLRVSFRLDQPRSIKRISLHCLEDIRSWIFPPKEIRVYGSASGSNYKLLATLNPEIPQATRESHASFFNLDFAPSTCQFLRIEVDNLGTLPEWHESAGSPSWLFVDEVIIP